MTKSIITGILAMAVAGSVHAQEFGIELGGGFQGLQYDIPHGKSDLQFGGSIGFHYTYPIAKHWGLLTGITGGYYSTKASMQNSIYTTPVIDDLGSAVLYNVHTTDYRETQSFFAAGIPVMLQYHCDLPKKMQWYMNFGGKVMLPFSTKVKASAQQIRTTGYYPDFGIEVSDVPEHGFGTLTDWKGNSAPDLKPTVTLSAATGVSFPAGNKKRLYVGVYADYGINNMLKTENAAGNAPITYNTADVNAVQSVSVLNTTNIDKAKLLGFGLQVKLGFGNMKEIKSAKDIRAEKEEQQAELQQAKEDALQAEIQQAKDAAMQAKDAAVQARDAAIQTKENMEREKADAARKSLLSQQERSVLEQPINFGNIGNTTIPEDAKPHLDDVAYILQKHPDMSVNLTGHTCNIGTETENRKIGSKRARAVADYLREQGVARRQMKTSSAGDTQPIAPETSEENRKKNRRVGIVVN
jgi:outer membrane protein OmpA-like peptidoglycan-associated protein